VPGRLWAFLIAAATALVILGASILPFATPAYVRLEQDRTGVGTLTGLSAPELDRLATSILGDLFLWQGGFEVKDSRQVPVLNEREQVHMRDVRGVFAGFELLALASVVLLALAFRRGRDGASRAAAWRAVVSGARGLVVALVAVGAFAILAFDAAFELFHRLFFNAGSYTFDPRTDRLVQLFPEQFWSETAMAVGVVAIVVAVITAWQAGRRAGVSRSAPIRSTSTART
jgi:integral membrane protein (TIGR01906 family)